eukprot:c8478_g1_i1 orf=101-2176(+)
MTSYSNMKIHPNLDKPPLFNSGYRTGGSETNKPVNFNSLPALPRISGNAVVGAPANDFKVPKLENEIFFSSDADLPSFKRPKFVDESQQLQINSLPRRDLPAVPLFANQRSPISVEHEDMCDQARDEDGPMATATESIDIESHFNPLNEPSPLGLNLRKSPSLLDLIQRKLAHNEDDGSDGFDQGGKLSRLGSSAFSADKDKLKAANFPASKLRIGTWECASRYDGDLVAKCYYAKRKLVWEVLDSGLKSKMEVQWSDISALKAIFPDDQPAIFDIELSRPPLFFREINPQPRKHTLWQSTSDFTDGQATICRHHSVQFPVGVLNKHFEKLLQCDARLKALNDQTRSIQDSCFFDNRSMQIDRQHMLHYQSVLADHAALQPLTIGGMTDEALLQPAAVRAVDCSQSHVSVQGFQNEPLQHLSPHHVAVENIKSIRLEGLSSEPLQRAVPIHSDVAPGSGVHHRQGGFQLQFATAASPSSVIDLRGLNESSSSSETEDAPLKDIGRTEGRSEPLNLHISQDSRQFSPLRNGPIRQLNEWTSRHSQEGSMAWNSDRRVPAPLTHTYETLNALSLHLLGEPIAATDRRPYSLGRGNERDVHEMLGSSHVQQSIIATNKDFVHKNKKNLVNLHHGHLASGDSRMFNKIRDGQWNAMLEQHALEAGSSSLASHGSYGELVYLPRIASQPQFLEPGP